MSKTTRCYSNCQAPYCHGLGIVRAKLVEKMWVIFVSGGVIMFSNHWDYEGDVLV